MIDVIVRPEEPRLIEIVFSGRLEVAELRHDTRFTDRIQQMKGAPFRVLCDFSNTMVMRDDVAEAFAQSLSYAAKRGMDRDAYVCQTRVLELQITRLARDVDRSDTLGAPRFFERREDAEVYLRS